jgi:hypothetical protein
VVVLRIRNNDNDDDNNNNNSLGPAWKWGWTWSVPPAPPSADHTSPFQVANPPSQFLKITAFQNRELAIADAIAVAYRMHMEMARTCNIQ